CNCLTFCRRVVRRCLKRDPGAIGGQMGAISFHRAAVAAALVGCSCVPTLAQYGANPQAGPPRAFVRPTAFVSDEPSERLPDAAVSKLPGAPPAAFHLTLEDAKVRTLENSIVMDLASTQVVAKYNTMQAASKDYLPKLLNSFTYFHFDHDLGTVVKTPGIFNPATAVAVPVINQDAPMYTAMLVQPITPLLKVREAVNITAADVGAAAAQKRLARRELTKGVEQLYFGILATQQIKAGLEQAVAGAQQAAEASKGP